MSKHGVEYDIKVNLDQINKNLAQIETNMRNTGRNIGAEGGKIQNTFNKIGAAAVAAFSLNALAGLAGKIIEVRSEFEKYLSVLTTAYGSAIRANAAMKMIEDTAKKTPFQLNKLTESFVMMKNRGLEPTQEDLINLGDLASAIGKDFDLLTGAVIDASDPIRWKNLGIKMKQMGDTMQLTFKGVTVEVENTTKGALEAAKAFGQLEGIAGSMEGQMDTLGGKVSNLKDAWWQLLKNLGDSKAWGAAVKGLTWFVENAILILAPIPKLISDIFSKFKKPEQLNVIDSFFTEISSMPADDYKLAIEKKLQEINEGRAKLEAAIYSPLKKNSFESVINNARYKELTDFANALQKELQKIDIPPEEDEEKGILSKLREDLKKLNEELANAPTEKLILEKQKEIEQVKKLIDSYEKLYETRKKDILLGAGKNISSPGISMTPSSAVQDTISSDKIFTDYIARTKAAQEEVEKVRQANVSSYKRMNDALAQLDKVYYDAKMGKDKAYYKEKGKIVGDFMQDSMQNVGQLADIVGQFDEKAGDAIARIGVSLDGLISGISSGNYIQAAMSGIQLLIDLGDELGDTFNIGLNFTKEIDAINLSLEKTAELVRSLSSNTGTSYYQDYYNTRVAINKELADSNKKLLEYKKNLSKADEVGLGAGILGGIAGLVWANKRKKELEKLANEEKARIKELEESLKEIEREWKANLTASTSESLANSIVEGFKRGESATEIFANNFKNLMMNAMGEVMKRKIIDQMMGEGGFYDKFAAAMEDGELSDQELGNLSNTYKEIIDFGEKYFNGMQAVLSSLPGAQDSASALKGGIKGITENTASKLEGSFNAVRISLIEQKAIALSGYNQLVMIEQNTRTLYDIRDILKSGSDMEFINNRANGR